MAYVALYRTYRPKSFAEVAGQEHITTTLKNALKNNKVGHAYLFSGPRGTGKTTIAKILAKAVNCELAPISDPCNKCSICTGLNKGTIGDVIEIDAASNNSVDEIRDLRDKVKYLPSVSKYKVYIIDEVHMLSSSAFNALLKTLEEPPKHVIFILATTEVYKIPSTILSRCQRFDFRAISKEEIFIKMKEIVKQEKISIDDDALYVIAENAEGGLRDALSLLDQAISYSGKHVSCDDVHKVSGSIAAQKIIEILEFVLKKDSSNAMVVLDELLQEGKEIPRIITDMVAFFRNVLVYKNVKNANMQMEVFKKDSFINIAKQLTNARIYFLTNILNETQNNIKWTNQKREYLEIALIKMCDDLVLKPVEETELLYELDKRIKVLENKKDIPKEIIKPIVNEEPKIDFNQIICKVLKHQDQNKLALLKKGWITLAKIEDPQSKNIANLLYNGTLEMVDDEHMIVSFDEQYQCNQMNKPMNKEIVLGILNRKTILVKDYLAFTKKEWNKILDDFVNQINSGIETPEIKTVNPVIETPIISECEELAYAFFGKDKVKTKEKK